MNSQNEVFVCYVGSFGNFRQTQHQYFSVARFKFHSEADVATFNDTVQKAGDQPVMMQNLKSEPRVLHDLLFNDPGEKRETVKFNFFVGLPNGNNEPFMTADMEIKDVPRYDHFDKADDQYPDVATYVMYGDLKDAYLFHYPTKYPDYLQVSHRRDILQVNSLLCGFCSCQYGFTDGLMVKRAVLIILSSLIGLKLGWPL